MRLFIFIAILLIHVSGFAQTTVSPPQLEGCFDTAAKKFSLDKTLLKAIAHTESGFNVNAISPQNSNATFDIGLMQINSAWLPTLSKYGISREKLQNPCANIHVGAWILANNISTYGRTWRAVGAYNSPTRSFQAVYVKKVQHSYTLLLAGLN